MSRPPIRLLVASLALILMGYVAYSNRLQMAALIWHWKNGDFVRVGLYEVPVPKRWMVEKQASGAFLIDTFGSRDTRTLAGINVISIESLPTITRDLEFRKSYQRKWLSEHGTSAIEERSLAFEDEFVACVGGDELHGLTGSPEAAGIVSVQCISSGKLHLTFAGQQPDLQIFYAIIPKIRKSH